MTAQSAQVNFDIHGKSKAIAVPESHVDLMGNITFTEEQLARRWFRESQKCGTRRAEQFQALNQWKDQIPAGHPARSQKKLDGIAAYATLNLQCQENLEADLAKNALLIDTIAYERAQADVERLTLRINGRAEQVEVPEETDPETGVISQEYVPYVPAIEAIPPQIDSVDDQGNPVTADNPAYLEAVAARDAAQAVIDGAGQDVLDLVALRAG